MIKDKYNEWLIRSICDDVFEVDNYSSLLKYLRTRKYTYIIEDDSNRSEDGKYLRYRFVNSTYGYNRIPISIDGPCSVLEMLIALAIKCEETIMCDAEKGDRTAKWFWMMLDNLALLSQSDNQFNEMYVSERIDKFLFREYAPNGDGGLFPLANCSYDLRSVSVWYQLLWYINENF